MDTNKKELSNCTFVKTILMILVVVYHSTVFWTGTWWGQPPIYQSEVLSFFSKWLNFFHIYAFTFVSGYIFSYLKYEQGKYQQFLPFLSSKVKRLIIPYLFALGAWVIPISSFFNDYSLQDILYKFILGTAPGQLWFLLMLFGVFLVFWPLSDFLFQYDWLGLLLVLGFYGCSIIGNSLFPNVLQIWKVFSYMPFFWVGFKIRQHGSAYLMKIPSLVYIAADVVLFTVVQYLSRMTGLMPAVLKMGLSFILRVVGAIMAFVLLQRLAEHVRWQDSKVFAILKKYSMPMYLFHQQAIYFSIYYFNGLINPYMHAIVNSLIALSVSIAVSALLLRFRLTSFLVGEK